jgi:hypothetical protein
LVERMAQLCSVLGRSVATPSQARAAIQAT